jgi:hypothetical protein
MPLLQYLLQPRNESLPLELRFGVIVDRFSLRNGWQGDVESHGWFLVVSLVHVIYTILQPVRNADGMRQARICVAVHLRISFRKKQFQLNFSSMM